jgi:hypothetical protein
MTSVFDKDLKSVYVINNYFRKIIETKDKFVGNAREYDDFSTTLSLYSLINFQFIKKFNINDNMFEMI